MKQARPYQQQCIQDVFDSYDRNIRAGIINLHVGGGKTFIAGEIVREMRRRFPHHGALFLVDQRELAFQAKEAFQTAHPELRIGIEMGTYHATKKDDIVIACVATMGRAGSMRVGKFQPDYFRTVIVDEAHKALAPIWQRVLSWAGVHRDNFQDHKLLVGLTGTAYRHDGQSLGLLFDDVFYTRTIADGIKDGWLTDIEYVQIETNVDISNVHTRGGEFIQSELADAIDSPVRNAQIIKAYKEYGENKTALVFAGSVEHAYKLAELFNEDGIPAICIEGGTDEKRRKDVVNAFRNECDYKVITNYGVFSTGTDFPELGTIILARPIKSTVLYTQIVGRVLRPSATAFVDAFQTAEERRKAIAESSKPTGRIIDFLDNTGKHNVCTLPVLFGANPKLKTKKKRFFQEVVEVLEEVRRERNIDISQIVDPDNVTIQAKRSRFKLKQLEPDEYIKKCSSNLWLPIKDGLYELNLSSDNIILTVEQNMVGKYELFEYNTQTQTKKLLNTFGSVAGAIKVADEYIEQMNFNTRFVKQDKWRDDPPTQKQLNQLYKMFGKSNKLRFIGGKYSNNVSRFAVFGQPITTKGQAATLLNEIWSKK